MNTQMDRLTNMHNKVFARFVSATSTHETDLYRYQLENLEERIFEIVKETDKTVSLADIRYYTREESEKKMKA